jgi:hypothetical protein
VSTPAEKLTRPLQRLHDLQAGGRRVFNASELARLDRERLVAAGWLQEAMKGWLISSSPETRPGDTTPWYVSYWEFCARYLDDRFGVAWHLAAEPSLLLHAGDTTIPRQLIVHAPGATNDVQALPGETSLVLVKTAAMPPGEALIRRDGLRLLTLPEALVRVGPTFFQTHQTDALVALSLVRDASDVLGPLLAGGRSVVAGRVAGALRAVGKGGMADTIVRTMRELNHDTRESNPFEEQHTPVLSGRAESPYVRRLELMWAAMRDTAAAAMPPAPGLPKSTRAFLKRVDEIYRDDAYHSLSIEGYRVTAELIERVSQGNWNPVGDAGDREARNALAARGYWQAFQRVKASVTDILAGASPAAIAERDHGDWFREMFEPSVRAGILKPRELMGYRGHPVYIRNARHVPPSPDAVRDLMPALIRMLANEPEAGVRAVLGHFAFVWIQPYMDGNGRCARFLMNAMLASGGYPWTVIRLDERPRYFEALNAASDRHDIGPFAAFIGEAVRRSEQPPPKAAK